MVKQKVKPEGGEIIVETAKLEEQPIVISQTQAKALLKKANPPKPRSQAQIENFQKIVEANKAKWAKAKAEKEQAEKDKAEEAKKVSTKIVVLPKRPRKVVSAVSRRETLREKPQPVEEEQEESSEDDAIQIKPAKKTSHKAKELVEEVTKIDEKIRLLKATPTNRYDALLRF